MRQREAARLRVLVPGSSEREFFIICERKVPLVCLARSTRDFVRHRRSLVRDLHELPFRIAFQDCSCILCRDVRRSQQVVDEDLEEEQAYKRLTQHHMCEPTLAFLLCCNNLALAEAMAVGLAKYFSETLLVEVGTELHVCDLTTGMLKNLQCISCTRQQAEHLYLISDRDYGSACSVYFNSLGEMES